MIEQAQAQRDKHTAVKVLIDKILIDKLLDFYPIGSAQEATGRSPTPVSSPWPHSLSLILLSLTTEIRGTLSIKTSNIILEDGESEIRGKLGDAVRCSSKTNFLVVP